MLTNLPDLFYFSDLTKWALFKTFAMMFSECVKMRLQMGRAMLICIPQCENVHKINHKSDENTIHL